MPPSSFNKSPAPARSTATSSSHRGHAGQMSGFDHRRGMREWFTLDSVRWRFGSPRILQGPWVRSSAQGPQTGREGQTSGLPPGQHLVARDQRGATFDAVLPQVDSASVATIAPRNESDTTSRVLKSFYPSLNTTNVCMLPIEIGCEKIWKMPRDLEAKSASPSRVSSFRGLPQRANSDRSTMMMKINSAFPA